MNMENYKEKMTIIVIEQNASVRKAICNWIEDMFVDHFCVIEIEPKAKELAEMIPQLAVALVLIDLDLLRRNEYVIYKKVRTIYPQTKIILMSTEEPFLDQSKKMFDDVDAFVNKFNLHNELYPLLEMHLSEQK